MGREWGKEKWTVCTSNGIGYLELVCCVRDGDGENEDRVIFQRWYFYSVSLYMVLILQVTPRWALLDGVAAACRPPPFAKGKTPDFTSDRDFRVST